MTAETWPPDPVRAELLEAAERDLESARDHLRAAGVPDPKRDRSGLVEACIRFVTVLILIGVVVLYVTSNRRAEEANARADRIQDRQTIQTRQLREVLAAVAHNSSCVVLYTVYRSQYTQAARPPTAATDLDPNGGLTIPDAHTFDLSGCQDVLDTRNLAPLKETP